MKAMVDVYSFKCPHCGARVGEYCVGRDHRHPHAARRAKVPKGRKSRAPQSVQAVPTYFESNRRKH